MESKVDYDAIRRALMACLRAEAPRKTSMLADMQTKHAKGEMKLKRSSGNWSTQVHATPTRPPGYSREAISEMCFAHARYSRLVWGLSAPQIKNILARYHPSPQMRSSNTERLRGLIGHRYKSPDVKARAVLIADAILTGNGSAKELRKLLGMGHDEWRNSAARKQAHEIRFYLTKLDCDSLIAWQKACETLDVEEGVA